MKNSLKIFALLLVFLLGAGNSSAQGKTRKSKAVIKSNVECELCKSNVENHLSKINGVRKVSADFKTREITVVFNSRRITIEQIRKNLADLGYDADDVPANNRMNQLLKHKQATTN